MIGIFWIIMSAVWLFIIYFAIRNRRRGGAASEAETGYMTDYTHFNATHHQPPAEPAGFDGFDGGNGGGGGADGGWSDSGGDSGGGDSGGGDGGGGGD